METALGNHRWTVTHKMEIVLELLRGADVVELSRRHGMSQAQVSAWRDAFLVGGQAALRARKGAEQRAQERQLRQLERKVGQLLIENEILKKLEAMSRSDRTRSRP